MIKNNVLPIVIFILIIGCLSIASIIISNNKKDTFVKCTTISPIATDTWCNDNCNHDPPNCPKSMCKCDSTPGPGPKPPGPGPKPPGPAKCNNWRPIPMENHHQPGVNTKWCNDNCNHIPAAPFCKGTPGQGTDIWCECADSPQPAPGPPPAAQGWNCDTNSGLCNPSRNGTYKTQQACNSACAAYIPYTCVQEKETKRHQCIPTSGSGIGIYKSKDQCMRKCRDAIPILPGPSPSGPSPSPGPTPPGPSPSGKYVCTGGPDNICPFVNNPSSTDITFSSQSACLQDCAWTQCTQGNCVPGSASNPNTYITKSKCKQNCSPPPPPAAGSCCQTPQGVCGSCPTKTADYCLSSKDACENSCGGKWCPFGPSPSPSPGPGPSPPPGPGPSPPPGDFCKSTGIGPMPLAVTVNGNQKTVNAIMQCQDGIKDPDLVSSLQTSGNSFTISKLGSKNRVYLIENPDYKWPLITKYGPPKWQTLGKLLSGPPTNFTQKGKISITIDLSNADCGSNAAFYMVIMRDSWKLTGGQDCGGGKESPNYKSCAGSMGEPTDCNDFYADGSNLCAPNGTATISPTSGAIKCVGDRQKCNLTQELDLFEGNLNGFQVASHNFNYGGNVGDSWGSNQNYLANKVDPSHKWIDNNFYYGPNPENSNAPSNKKIDSTKPFTVNYDFKPDGIYISLNQNGNILSFDKPVTYDNQEKTDYPNPNAGKKEIMSALNSGRMSFVFSYWGWEDPTNTKNIITRCENSGGNCGSIPPATTTPPWGCGSQNPPLGDMSWLDNPAPIHQCWGDVNDFKNLTSKVYCNMNYKNNPSNTYSAPITSYGGATFSNLTVSNDGSGPAPGPGPGTQKYKCMNGTCQQSSTGTMSLDDCNKTCVPSPPITKYVCMNDTCQQSSTGTMSLDDCNKTCGGPSPPSGKKIFGAWSEIYNCGEQSGFDIISLSASDPSKINSVFKQSYTPYDQTQDFFQSTFSNQWIDIINSKQTYYISVGGSPAGYNAWNTFCNKVLSTPNGVKTFVDACRCRNIKGVDWDIEIGGTNLYTISSQIATINKQIKQYDPTFKIMISIIPSEKEYAPLFQYSNSYDYVCLMLYNGGMFTKDNPKGGGCTWDEWAKFYLTKQSKWCPSYPAALLNSIKTIPNSKIILGLRNDDGDGDSYKADINVYNEAQNLVDTYNGAGVFFWVLPSSTKGVNKTLNSILMSVNKNQIQNNDPYCNKPWYQCEVNVNTKCDFEKECYATKCGKILNQQVGPKGWQKFTDSMCQSGNNNKTGQNWPVLDKQGGHDTGFCSSVKPTIDQKCSNFYPSQSTQYITKGPTRHRPNPQNTIKETFRM